MEIQWYGQACFKLTSETGFVAVTDPFDAQTGYPLPHLTANLVTISHEHHDHNNREWVKGNPIYLDRVGHCEIQGVTVHSFPSYHDDQRGEKRGKNLIFLFEMDGLRICHLGDLGHPLDAQMMGEIGQVDVLLLPVGGYYTIDGPQAWTLVQEMRPRVAIPMHFHTIPGTSANISDEAPFLQSAGVHPIPQDILKIDATTLPPATTVVLLDWKH